MAVLVDPQADAGSATPTGHVMFEQSEWLRHESLEIESSTTVRRFTAAAETPQPRSNRRHHIGIGVVVILLTYIIVNVLAMRTVQDHVSPEAVMKDYKTAGVRFKDGRPVVHGKRSTNELPQDAADMEAEMDASGDPQMLPVLVDTIYEKVKLQVGWLVGFFLILSTLFVYLHVQEWLAPYTGEPLPTGHDQGDDFEASMFVPLDRVIWTVLNHNKLFLGTMFTLAGINFFTFTIATEALYNDQHGNFLMPPGWPLIINQCVAFISWLVFGTVMVLRLLTVRVDPHWSHFGKTAALRYSIANVYTLIEILALVFSFKCQSIGSHRRDQGNFLWLFLVRSFEVLENGGMGLGVRRLRIILTEDGKLLSVGFIFGAVIWTIMSGLYFLTNKDCPADGCPETADWPAYVYQYQWLDAGESPAPWRKFESIPSSAWYVLVNLVKEHPLADAHAFFWQRVNVCIVCIFAMPLFALPMSILTYSLFRTAKESASNEDMEPGDPGPGNVRSRTTRREHHDDHFDPSLGPVLTAVLSYGCIFVYWFYTARGMTYARIFTVEVAVSHRAVVICDTFVSLVFAAEWAFHFIILGAPYVTSSLGLIDASAWIFGIIHALWYVVAADRVPEAVVASSILRLFKLERFLGNFGDLYHIAKKNRLLLLATVFLSMLIWMIMSTMLWITDGCIMYDRLADSTPVYQCRNNDPEQTEQYASVERSLWAEIINIHGEWPWADYTPEGKAVGTIIALFAIVLFCVPISVFAEGYQEQIESSRGEHDLTFDRRPWQAKCRPSHRGLGQVVYDLLYAHLHSRPGDRRRSFILLRGASIVFVVLNVIVTMCCTVQREDMPAFWQDVQRYEGLMEVNYWVDFICLCYFSFEFGCRLIATDWHYAYSLAGLADTLSLFALSATVSSREFREKAFHPNYDEYYQIQDDCIVLLRVLRLFCLESYTSALHVLKTVVWLNRRPLLRSGQTMVASWFVHATLLYVCERPAGRGDAEMSRRYTDMLRALQYSIVHLFGDYPESDYGFPAKVVHFCGIMFGIAILAAFTGVFSASFVSYVRRERQEQLQHVTARRLILATRVAIRIQVQFRKWKEKAQRRAAHRAVAAEIGNMPRSALRKSVAEIHASVQRIRSNPRLMSANVVEGRSIIGRIVRFVFQVALVVNLATTMILSMPELDAETGTGRWLRDAFFMVELVCTGLFTTELLIKLHIVNEHTVRWRTFDALSLIPGYSMAVFEVISYGWTQSEKEEVSSTLQALNMFRVIRVLDFPYIRREVMLICRSLRDAWGLLAIPVYLSLTVWIATSALFMWLENYFKDGSEFSEYENMNNLPSAMYWCCMFLTGEWANVDFTFPGSRLCIFYVIFGIAVFSIPVGILVEAIHSTATLAHAEDEDMRKLLQSISESNLDEVAMETTRSHAPMGKTSSARKSVWTFATEQMLDSFEAPRDSLSSDGDDQRKGTRSASSEG